MALTHSAVQAARAGRATTVALTDDRALALARAWVKAWDDLEPRFRDALDRLADDAGDAAVISATTIARDQRTAQALEEALAQLEDLAKFTADSTAGDLPAIVVAAADAQFRALQAQLPPDATGAAGLGRLDNDALDAIVARTAEQIHALTIPLAEDAVVAMRSALVSGITLGQNPRAAARRMLNNVEGRFAGGLARAERIARTEMLDAHRAADQAMSEKNRSLIAAQVWCATLDSKTCGSCLGMHGTEWPADAFGPLDHQQGRCTFLPRTRTWAELGFTGIEDQGMDLAAERDAWWDNLTPQSQDRILGAARAKHLRDGGTWSDMSTERPNANWRTSYGLTPLQALPTPTP